MTNPVWYFGNRQEPIRHKPLHQWKQVHGANVVWVDSDSDSDYGEADGFITSEIGRSIGVVTADCVPILLYHPEKKITSALHAGWRSTEKGIVPAWAHLISEAGHDPAEFHVQIGPSIRGCCYEVSQDVLNVISTAFPMIDESLFRFKERNLDLALLNEAVLNSLGIEHVAIHPDCTFCCQKPAETNKTEPVYFSFRRGDRESRQYSTILFGKDGFDQAGAE